MFGKKGVGEAGICRRGGRGGAGGFRRGGIGKGVIRRGGREFAEGVVVGICNTGWYGGH